MAPKKDITAIIPLELIELSKWAGQRFDLVQAQCGEASYKTDDGFIIVKAANTPLSAVSATSGFAHIELAELRKALSKLSAEQATLEKQVLTTEALKTLENLSTSTDSALPCPEAFLHAHLDTYVLHTHGILVSTIASRITWEENFRELYPESLCISYKTPGIELAIELDAKISDYIKTNGKKPSVIFMQNYGLIVSAPTAQEVKFITEEVTVKLEQRLNIKNNTYRLSSVIAESVNSVFGFQKIAYLSNDAALREFITNAKPLFFQRPVSPETSPYCGARLLIIGEFNDVETLKKFNNSFHTYPRVIICKDLVFFVADSVQDARNIEESLKFHLSSLVINAAQQVKTDSIHFLEDAELVALAKWEPFTANPPAADA